jgi:hypothetical protein
MNKHHDQLLMVVLMNQITDIQITDILDRYIDEGLLRYNGKCQGLAVPEDLASVAAECLLQWSVIKAYEAGLVLDEFQAMAARAIAGIYAGLGPNEDDMRRLRALDEARERLREAGIG